MHKPYKKITASLLLFSHMLTSCYNPKIGMGKKSIPQAQEAAAGNTYHAEEPYDKYRDEPTSHTLTTADNQPIAFTYLNGQWQAEVEEYATNDSCQGRQLPVVFERGFTLQDLVDSNPAEQKQVIHLCPSEEEPD